MITAWMLYAVVVTALVGAGALAVENILRAHGLPSRWLWAGALALSLGWPLGQIAWMSPPAKPSVPGPAQVIALAPPASPPVQSVPVVMTLEVPRGSILRALDGPVMMLWAGATSVLLLFFTFLLLRTSHLRSRWPRGKIGGQAVLYSDEWGPAVVGFLSPQIVLPEWCQEMEARALRLILDHELEHVRAGDLRLIVLSALLPILLPWNLPLWWQWSRMRVATEGDCDLRVLKKNPGQAKPYMELLLDVGERAVPGRALAAMLSEPYESLKRRIGIMTMPFPRRPWVRGVLLAGAGALLVAVACWAPGPTDAQDEEPLPDETAVPREAEAAKVGATFPVFTPYTVSPSLRNRDEVLKALERDYPPRLRDSGVGGTVQVWFFIDETGRVQRTQVNESSGHEELDGAALRVATMAVFTPALNRDQKRPVWVSLPVEFATAGDSDSRGVAATGASNEASAPIDARVTAQASDEMGEVGGIVRDVATGQPLQGAQMFVDGTGRGTLSDAEGRFLIQHVPVGEQDLVAVLIGFGRAVQRVAVSEGERADAVVGLQPTAIPLEKLVVKAIRRLR